MENPAACCLCIVVSNLSAFPITITEVGFGVPKGQEGERQYWHKPRLSHGEAIPIRLESRESVVAYFKKGELALPAGPRAYAVSDGGTVALGSSPIIQALWRTANRKKQKAT